MLLPPGVVRVCPTGRVEEEVRETGPLSLLVIENQHCVPLVFLESLGVLLNRERQVQPKEPPDCLDVIEAGVLWKLSEELGFVNGGEDE